MGPPPDPPMGPPTGPLPVPGASRVVARQVARRCSRSAVVWGLVFGAYTVSSISGYAGTYPTAASREALARSLGSNVGLAAIFGPARSLDTVAGFVAWRGVGALCLVGGVWGLLAATRLLRGEEEAGRAELLLTGHTTRRRAAVQGLVGLGAGWLTLLAITAAMTIPDGATVKPALPAAASLYFSVAVTSTAAVFLAVGAVTSQLARTRRRAATIAGAVLGVSYLTRLVADSGSNLKWLRWASPLGWVEELRPFTGSHPLALIPTVALTLGLAATAVWLAGRRDLGASILPEADTAEPRTALVGGTAGLSLRLLRPTAITWLLAIAWLTFIIGLIAKSAGPAISGSATAQKAFDRLGGTPNGALTYLGVGFLTGIVLLALVAAGQNVANREEEATGRLDNLVVRPTSRRSWLLARLATEAAILLVIGVASGVAGWLGAATQHTGVAFPTVLAAGLNIVPAAIFLLGLGALVHGAAPRLVAPVTYGLVAWSFLLEFVSAVLILNHWILDTSILHHVTLAPAVNPNWGSAAGLVALGAGAGLLGAALLGRRDLINE